MKMDASNDYSTTGNGRIVSQASKPARDGQPSPKDIGREFVRQYYTMLSERPQDVFRFYSHESFFMHGSEDPIQGQQNIQKAIENLQFVDCKARIHTVNGTSTVNSGLVIQVCGELSIRKEAGRRFLQTFILCPQTPKKYYVHNDVFQWLDQAFGHENRDRSESESPSAAGSAYAVMTDMNGVNSVVNGQEDEHLPHHNGHHPQHEPTTSDSSGLSHVPANGPTMGDDPASTEVRHAIDTGAEEDDRMAPQSMDAATLLVQETTAPDVPVEPEPPAVPPGPMTWASRVARPSAPTKTAPVAANVPVQREVPAQPQRAPPTAAVTQQQHASSVEARQERMEPTDPACKLYLGSILRTLSPKNPQDCEAEIKKVFEQFGPVYSVRVPRKAIDESMHDDNNRLAAGFAFVVMETKEGSDKAYAACSRDEKGRTMLHVNLPSFGFNGQAALSQQDTDRRGAGGSSQRGGYNGGQGGGRPGGNYSGGIQQNQYMGGGGPRGGRGGGMQSGAYRGGSSGAPTSQRGGGGGPPQQFNRPRPPPRNLQ